MGHSQVYGLVVAGLTCDYSVGWPAPSKPKLRSELLPDEGIAPELHGALRRFLAVQRRLALFALGGTISMVSGRDGNGARPELDASELLRLVPQVGVIADQIETVPFRRTPSASLAFGDALELSAEIQAQVNAGANGVVVVQGTDTLEEMAFALELLLDVAVPVVVTGAIIPADKPGADGPANLIAAVRVALSSVARGLGVTVVFGQEIHAARFVQKRHTFRPSAFESSGGPLGWVVEDRVRVVGRPAPLPTIPAQEASSWPSVPLLRLALGDDGALLACVAAGAHDGAVVEAFGGGHVPHWLIEPLQDLADAMPLVLASRTGGGEVLAATYGFDGSEKDLLSRGLLSAGWLDGLKARTLLTLLLAAGTERQGIELVVKQVNRVGLEPLAG